MDGLTEKAGLSERLINFDSRLSINSKVAGHKLRKNNRF